MDIWEIKVDFGWMDEYETYQLINRDEKFTEDFKKSMQQVLPQKEKYSNVEIHVISGHKSSDVAKLWNESNSLIFSQKAKEALEKILGDSVEWIPTNKPNKYLLHTLSAAEALDIDNTTYTSYGAPKEIVLDFRKIPKENIFRLKYKYGVIPGKIYIAEQVKQVIEQEKLTGIVFEKAKYVSID